MTDPIALSPAELTRRGAAFSRAWRMKEAYADLTAALRLAPDDPEVRYQMGRHHMRNGHVEMALIAFHELRRRTPGYRDVAERFETCLGRLRFPPPFDITADLIAALDTGQIDDLQAARIIAQVLTRRHGIAADMALDDTRIATITSNRLFRLYLRMCRNIDPAIEAVMRRLRRRAAGLEPGPALPAGLLADLAIGFANGDYVVDWPADEAAVADRLRTALTGAEAVVPGAVSSLVMTLALYEAPPVAAVAQTRSAAADDDGIAAFIARFHDEPLALAAEPVAMLGQSEPTATNAVSARVRHQYETAPYPRWRGLLPPAVRDFRETLARSLPLADLPASVTRHLPARPDILIAGCGTGRHPARRARATTCRSLLAIDLSHASLAYAALKARELGLADEIRFARADILDLPALLPSASFDLVEAAGVLHHMDDPFRGWQVLRDLLRPGGWMRIGLYSRTARRTVTRARAWLAERSWGKTPEDIRRFRRELVAGRLDPALEPLAAFADLHNLNHLRDLLFHEQELTFTPEMIRDHLDRLGLTFAGFSPSQPEILYAYRQRFPEDPTATDLDRWAAFEADHPDAFLGMYQFWCYDPRQGDMSTGESAVRIQSSGGRSVHLPG
ncbi:class I SAM-dependent methyltransferase (plasmid) [Tistrella mobilis]|uniref:methyltransferase domain-containing protein n=1 Tax=Tistrella mobilis TaxID=171437 RepID=UPI0035585DCB